MFSGRGEFIDENDDNSTYQHAPPYDKLIDGGLEGYHEAWVTACNERNGTSYTTADFHVNSGYRNAHHNDYHAGSTASHSLHQ